jgi:esterase
MRLAFKVQGDGVPLIIVHGFLGSSDNWRTMSKLLSEHFRVFTVDLRNHGQSPHSAVMNYQIMAEDLREFIEEHGLRFPHVLGHSMGGKVAMQLALQYPGMLGKLVVVDIAPKTYPSTYRPLLTTLRALPLQAYNLFSEIDAALSVAIPDQIVRQFLLKNLTRDPHDGFRWRIALDAIIQNYDELTKAIVAGPPFTKPACFIRGGRSNLLDQSDFPAIRVCFPQAQFKTIGNAGHWVHFDAADEFYTMVTDFLAPSAE